MNRRGILAAGVAATGGFAQLAAAGPSTKPTRRGSGTQFIETHDDVALFYQDFGTGRPVVFAAPWSLGCGWWEYQMAGLVGRGMRCVAYDRRGQDKSAQPAP